MPTFEDHQKELQEIEAEIVRLGIALGIDWNNHLEVSELSLLIWDISKNKNNVSDKKILKIAGLAQLMLHVITEATFQGTKVQTGLVWNKLSTALMTTRPA